MAEIAVAALLSATFFSKTTFRKHSCALSVLIFVAVIPSVASAEKRILIEVSKSEKTPFKRLTAGSQSSGTEDVNSFNARIWGKMLDIGRDSNVDGRMHLLPANCADDESSFARLPGGWVAVLNYTERLTVSTGSGTVGECPGVVDRMKRALMFGASAIIILTLNPKIIKELDLSQMFSKPVALVDISENITNMLHILSSKMKFKARFLYSIVQDIQDSQKFFTTVTLWGTCGRYSGRSYHEWDGVVCLGEDQNTNKDGKVDQENFWNYFYTGILVLMMIHYLRTRREQNWEDPDYIDGSLRQLAYQALAVMKIKRYSPDGTNDTCAICLEKFFHKQKLRVLPCGHYFHTKCVDPWLVRSHTCPLCKLNIIGLPAHDEIMPEGAYGGLPPPSKAGKSPYGLQLEKLES